MDKEIKLVAGIPAQALIAERIFNNRRISVGREDISKDVKVIFEVINYINSQPENVTRILDRNIDEFVIPVEFKDFVLPNSVRYDVGNRLSIDLLVRSNLKTKQDYNVYLNSISRIRAAYRKGSQEDLVMLKDLRKDVSFEDVRERASFNIDGKFFTKFEGIPFIPIRLNFGSQFFDRCIFNVEDFYPVAEFVNTLNN